MHHYHFIFRDNQLPGFFYSFGYYHYRLRILAHDFTKYSLKPLRIFDYLMHMPNMFYPAFTSCKCTCQNAGGIGIHEINLFLQDDFF